jgi:hypothetical protein
MVFDNHGSPSVSTEGLFFIIKSALTSQQPLIV